MLAEPGPGCIHALTVLGSPTLLRADCPAPPAAGGAKITLLAPHCTPQMDRSGPLPSAPRPLNSRRPEVPGSAQPTRARAPDGRAHSETRPPPGGPGRAAAGRPGAALSRPRGGVAALGSRFPASQAPAPPLRWAAGLARRRRGGAVGPAAVRAARRGAGEAAGAGLRRPRMKAEPGQASDGAAATMGNKQTIFTEGSWTTTR